MPWNFGFLIQEEKEESKKITNITKAITKGLFYCAIQMYQNTNKKRPQQQKKLKWICKILKILNGKKKLFVFVIFMLR